MTPVHISLRLNTNNAPRQLADVSHGLTGVGQAAAGVQAPAASAAAALSRVAHYAATGLGLQVVTQQAQQAAGALFNASAAAERLGTQLAFASSTPAKDMEFLRETTARLGLQFSSTAQAFAGFAAAAKGTSLEGEGARRVFASVAASASVMGLSVDQQSGALLAIQQMMSKGVVSAEEFRGQLGERMPVALQAGAKALGVTTAEFSKMLESGQVIASDFLPKFAVALDELLGDAAENAAGRLDAAVNQMGNAWEQLKTRLGNAGVSQGLASEARALGQVFDAAADNMDNAAARGGGALQQWGAGVGTVFGRSVLSAVAGTFNVFNASINAVTGNVFALNENLSLLPDSLRTNAQLTARLTPRILEAQTQYELLQQRLSQSPENIYIKSELAQLGAYIAKLQEAAAERKRLEIGKAVDQEAGNSRGSRANFEREVAESTKFVQDEMAKATGQSQDYAAKLQKYQQALARGVLSQADYVTAVSRLATENYKLSDAQKDAAKAAQDQAAAAVQFGLARQKLTSQDLVADVKSRVAMQVLTEEEGAKEITRITLTEIQQRVQAEQRLAGIYAKDPAKAAGHANAAKLATQEATNAQNAGLRELAAMSDKRDRAYAQALAKVAGDSIERRQSLEGETQALQLQTEQARAQGIVIDSVATLLEREKAERYGVALAMAEQNLQAQAALGLTAEQARAHQVAIEQLRAMRDAAQGVAQASADKDLAQAGLDQAKRLGGGAGDAQADPFKEWGSTLRETFATAGDGLARMVDAMGTLVKSGETYAREMRVIEDLRNSGTDENRKTADENELRLIKKTEAAQINAYASMASAAKGYFGKQTAAYKVLQGAEKALRTYQLIMSAQTMAKDLAGIAAKVTAWLAGDAAITTSAVASSATQVAATTAVGAASATAGVATQALGDPYTAFPRMAAMAAMMAALGFAVSGGGSSAPVYDDFAAQKANDGTGTVFGDAKAQSESIAKSLEAMESMARPELSYTSEMVRLLRNIDGSLSGTTNILLASGFDALGNSFQGSSTKKLNIDMPLIGGLFGGSSSSTSLADVGLAFAQQTVAQAMQSMQVQQYQVTRTDWEKSGFLGIGRKSGTNYNTSMAGVDGQVSQAMSTVLTQLTDAVTRTATQLGATAQQVQTVSSMDTGLGKVSLKDKTGEEIQKMLSAVFSALGDKMAQTLAPGFQAFQKAGEGYLQTLTRLASGHEEATYYAEKLGMATAALSAVQNKFGDVATELLRQTLIQSVAVGSGIANIVQNFSGSVGDLANLYTDLQSVGLALRSMGQSASAVSTDLLRGAGGMDALKSGLDAFESDFMSASERAVIQQSRMAAEFARIGVAMPATAEQFKDLVKTIDTSTAAGQKALGGLLSLSGGFKDFLDAQSEATQAQRDLAQKWLDSGKSISQWADKLATGSLGLSTPQQVLSNSRGDYLRGLSLARGNDQDALGAITGQAQSYLQAARDASTSQAQYAAVLAQVRSELKSLPVVKSYEGQMLDALGLINTSIKDDVIATLNTRFTLLDGNVDGLLTYSELRTGLGVTDAQIRALMDAVDANGDGQISALEAQRAAIGGVATNTKANANALVDMNNNTLMAVSYNTARALDFAASQVSVLQKISDYSAIIAAKPATTVVNNSGGGGIIGKVLSWFGFAQGDVFGGSGIFTKPTSFNFGTQLGALGEAGPEAIMPLERLGDGALGVRALLPPMPPMQPMAFGAYGNVDVLELARVLQAGMRDLAQRIDKLDDNNNAGNAAIAAATAKTAKILNNASTGDALRTEVDA